MMYGSVSKHRAGVSLQDALACRTSENEYDPLRKSDHWTTAQGSLHYTDYENGYAALSLMKGYGDYGHLDSASRCVGCGRTHGRCNSTRCGECEELCVCKACGNLVPKDSGHYIDGDGFYCADCAQPCSYVEAGTKSEVKRAAMNRRGPQFFFCQSCAERSWKAAVPAQQLSLRRSARSYVLQ